MNVGRLRYRMRFERRSPVDAGGGVFEDAWSLLYGPVAASKDPIRSSEPVIEGRATALVLFDVWVRWSPAASGIRATDRLVDVRSGETFNIHSAEPPDGRREWMRLLVQKGGPDG